MRISVLDPDDRASSITSDQIRTITDRIEYLLVQTQLFNVITISQRDEILREQRFQSVSGCVDAQCAVEIGQLLGAGLMVGGAVSEMGEVLIISATEFNVNTGEIVAVAEYSTVGGITDLYFTGTQRIVEQLTGISLGNVALPGFRGITDSTRIAYLTVNSSTEGAALTIDADTTAYQMPLENLPLPAGFHQLRVFAHGYEDIIHQLQIGVGDTLKRTFELPVKTGELDLNSIPDGAEVWLDEIFQGVTPLRLSIPFGGHALRIRKEGYQDYSGRLNLWEAVNYKLVKLHAAVFPITIRTIPVSARSKLYLSGKYIGRIKEDGKVVELSPGTYDIRITSRDYEEIDEVIVVDEAGQNTFTYSLKELSDASPNSRGSGNPPEFKLGAGVSIGYPAIVNYNIKLQYEFFQIEYSAGFANEISGKVDLSQIVDDPGGGISGNQLQLGVGTHKASINFVFGRTNMYTRDLDGLSRMPYWDYKGLTLRKQSAMLYYEVGWLWGDGDVYKQEYFYAAIGFGFSVTF
ncbi:MAG: PEGA domain-containing protein [FCB group bacterium]|nr:PEGA domain-containing protein [FCB group bacterium]